MNPTPSRKQLPFWPGVVLITVVVPVCYWLKFGRVDGYVMGFTAFLLLVTLGLHFIPMLNHKYGAEQEKIKVIRGPFDWLGVVWLLSIPFAPFLMWLVDSLLVITLQNWKLLLGIKAGLCVLIPCVSVLPLLRYLRGKASPYALLILVIGTGFPVTIGWHSMSDFLQGPQQETVSVVSANAIHMSIRYREVTTDILEVKLSDGRTLVANTMIGTVAPGPADITLLTHTGIILAVK
jgi:hypothetical protein